MELDPPAEFPGARDLHVEAWVQKSNPTKALERVPNY
jgi:hypothetical protein